MASKKNYPMKTLTIACLSAVVLCTLPACTEVEEHHHPATTSTTTTEETRTVTPTTGVTTTTTY